MLQWLTNLDTELFLFFNVTLANPLFDATMPFITSKYSWIPVWVAVLVGLLWKGRKRGRIVLMVAILSVAAADSISYRVLKQNIQRIRPCNAVENVHLLVKKKSSYSMPSNHAANFFALATAFSFFYRRYRAVFFGLAALVAYSRVAVGVHYPFDILAGAAVGSLLALFFIWLWRKLSTKWPVLALSP